MHAMDYGVTSPWCCAAAKPKTGQRIKVYFVSDLDPSGLDLQRSWEDAMKDFGLDVEFIRIGLTRDQVRDNVDVRATRSKTSASKSKRATAAARAISHNTAIAAGRRTSCPQPSSRKPSMLTSGHGLTPNAGSNVIRK
jgi:hypothetical protein